MSFYTSYQTLYPQPSPLQQPYGSIITIPEPIPHAPPHVYHPYKYETKYPILLYLHPFNPPPQSNSRPFIQPYSPFIG